MKPDRWFHPDGRPRNVTYAKGSSTRMHAIRVTHKGGRDTMFGLEHFDHEGAYIRAIDQLIKWRGGATEETRQKLLDAWPIFCDYYHLVLVPKTIYTLEQRA